MTKPLKKYIFRQVQGIWKDVAGDSGTLANVLDELEIIIDDHTQFARLYFYEENFSIWYRAYNNAKITLDIWKIDQNKKCIRQF